MNTAKTSNGSEGKRRKSEGKHVTGSDEEPMASRGNTAPFYNGKPKNIGHRSYAGTRNLIFSLPHTNTLKSLFQNHEENRKRKKTFSHISLLLLTIRRTFLDKVARLMTSPADVPRGKRVVHTSTHGISRVVETPSSSWTRGNAAAISPRRPSSGSICALARRPILSSAVGITSRKDQMEKRSYNNVS